MTLSWPLLVYSDNDKMTFESFLIGNFSFGNIYIYNFYFMRRIYFLFSFWISERGNSLELDDRSPGHFISRTSPPAIHLSPSRQSSTSTDGGQLPGIGGGASGGTGSLTTSSGLGSASTGTLVAKKKRELFSSARSSRSGGSNKSSDFDSSCSKVSWCLRPTVLLKSENSAILRSPELFKSQRFMLNIFLKNKF